MKLNSTDYEQVGVISKHCDKRKLSIAETDALLFDLEELLCSFFYDVDLNYYSDDPIWRKFLDGGEYTDCNGKNVLFSGLTKAWAYFAYSRYVIINATTETPNGLVSKTNNFSIPTPLKETEAIATQWKNKGLIILKRALRFVCNNKDFDGFENYNFDDCEDCGCGDDCDGKTKARKFGLKTKNISKYGL